MSHPHINESFVQYFLCYNLDPRDTLVLRRTFPELPTISDNKQEVIAYVRRQVLACSSCKEQYISAVRECYDRTSNIRCETGEPPIELSDYDPLRIAHLVLVKD